MLSNSSTQLNHYRRKAGLNQGKILTSISGASSTGNTGNKPNRSYIFLKLSPCTNISALFIPEAESTSPQQCSDTPKAPGRSCVSPRTCSTFQVEGGTLGVIHPPRSPSACRGKKASTKVFTKPEIQRLPLPAVSASPL